MNTNLKILTFRRKALQKILADLDWELEHEPSHSIAELYDRALELIKESSLSQSQKSSELSALGKLRRRHECRKEKYSADDIRTEVVRVRAELDQLYREIETFHPAADKNIA